MVGLGLVTDFQNGHSWTRSGSLILRSQVPRRRWENIKGGDSEGAAWLWSASYITFYITGPFAFPLGFRTFSFHFVVFHF